MVSTQPFEAALMRLSDDNVISIAMPLYDIISEEDLPPEALEAELLDFYCRIYPDCADLIQKYSKNEQDEDGNSLFTLEDQSTLLEYLKNNVGQYLNTLKKSDIETDQAKGILEKLLEADEYLMLPTELVSDIIGESVQNLDIE